MRHLTWPIRALKYNKRWRIYGIKKGRMDSFLRIKARQIEICKVAYMERLCNMKKCQDAIRQNLRYIEASTSKHTVQI